MTRKKGDELPDPTVDLPACSRLRSIRLADDMCGIAGYSGTFEPALLDRMNRAQSHRGPDGVGQWSSVEQRAGLAHRRLAIIDLSLGAAQPMTSADGAARITFNGEIYNYREIRRDLESRGILFRTASDTEVLLEGYRLWGTEVLARLNGIFAFAVWDERARQLFIARDGFGVKPLYYTETDSGFLFASEIKALLSCQEVSREVDPIALDQYLAFLWCAAPRTPLRAVRKLRPGEAMVIRAGRIQRSWIFYDLPYGRRDSSGVPDGAISEADLKQKVRDQLEGAVRRQMVADVPVGAFLSGGLDSSSVVAMMRRVRPDYRPQCFAIGFPDDADMEGSPNDLPFARSVAEFLGVPLEEIVVRPESIAEIEHTIYHLDEPHGDPAPINVFLIARRARELGMKVLLSGAGGDDIFSGYRRHHALELERYWAWLPAPVRTGGRAAARLASPRSHLWRRIRRATEFANLPAEERLLSYFLWSSDALRRRLFSDRMAAGIGDTSPLDPLRESLRNVAAEDQPLNRMLYLEAKHFLADHNLNYTDKMAMAHGVEVRVPILDPELVRLAAGISPRMKQHRGKGKYIFREAMRGLLPPQVITRPKTGFGAPLRRWLTSELRSMTDDILAPQALRRRDIFDPPSVRRLVEDTRAGRVDGAYLVYAILSLELWFRIFVDGGSGYSQRDASTGERAAVGTAANGVAG